MSSTVCLNLCSDGSSIRYSIMTLNFELLTPKFNAFISVLSHVIGVRLVKTNTLQDIVLTRCMLRRIHPLTDGQPKNIMPPTDLSVGGCIKMKLYVNFTTLLMTGTRTHCIPFSSLMLLVGQPACKTPSSNNSQRSLLWIQSYLEVTPEKLAR